MITKLLRKFADLLVVYDTVLLSQEVRHISDGEEGSPFLGLKLAIWVFLG